MLVRTQEPEVNAVVNGALCALYVVIACFFISRYAVPCIWSGVNGTTSAWYCGWGLLGVGITACYLFSTKPRYAFERLWGLLLSVSGLIVGMVIYSLLYFLFC